MRKIFWLLPQQNAPKEVVDWVVKIAELAKPKAIEFCDGSEAEWTRLTDLMVETGMFTRLNPEKRPNSFLARSLPSDVARVESPHLYLLRKGRGCRSDQQLV